MAQISEKKRKPIEQAAFSIDGATHCLDVDQLSKLNKWLAEQVDRIDAQARMKGRGMIVDILKAKGEVYVGATSGVLEFVFSPTGLGTVIKVSCSSTGESIDLTDYDRW